MADPFASFRRKPAAATYGRKAIVARRLAQPETSPKSEHFSANLHTLPAGNSSLNSISSSDDSSESSSNEDNSDASQKRTRYGDSLAKVASVQEPRRTAQSAMSKLEQLYKDTKSPDRKYSSAREMLDSTKDSWDIGVSDITSIGIESRKLVKDKPVQKAKRTVKDKAGISVCVGSSSISSTRSKPKTTKTSSSNSSITSSLVQSGGNSQLKPAARSKPVAVVKNVPDKEAKPKPVQKKRSQVIAGTRTIQNKDNTELEQRVPISTNVGLGVVTDSAVGKARELDAWDMGDLLSSSPIFNRTAGFKRKASRKPPKRSGKGSDLPSSSPPSTPGRLLDSNRCSLLSSSLANSDNSSDHEQHLDISETTTPKTPAVNAFKGPSIATSKRLQSRAFSQNVVYKYGRARSEEDDELAADFSRALGLPTLSDATSRPLLESVEFGSSNDSVDRLSSAAHSVEYGSSDHDRLVSSKSFKRILNDILRGFSTSAAIQASSACFQLLEQLANGDFCEELLCDKQGLSALLRGMHRARKHPIALSTAMLLITLAFSRPAVMQMLVFERQALEMVAELLKASTGPDILTLRCRINFSTREQHQCVARICSIVREQQLVGDQVAISTYNLALAALHGLTRKDDAAYLAMAPLLRSEMYESGCLDLIAERMLSWSIPNFTGLHTMTPDTQMTVVNDIFEPSGDDNGDMWMDFNLPEEQRNTLPTHSAATAATSGRGRLQKIARCMPRLGKFSDSALERELDSTTPTPASIALELEILQFCATASAENQGEILANDSCVPMLLELLAKSQQDVSRRSSKTPPVSALETVVLVLQLLVNLANNSTAFSARFVACDGMDVVAKNVAIVSQRLSPSRTSSDAASADFSPTRKALADEVGDLRYDVLLVTSALLTNIVDSDPSCAVHISHVRQDQQCRLTQSCFPSCRCDNRVSLVVLLAQAFVACHTAPTSADATIAAGYLSVLLGFLMREPQNGCRNMIRKHLPQRDVAVVIEHIKKFMHISDTVNKRFAGLLSGSGLASTGSCEHAISGLLDSTQATDISAMSVSTPRYNSATTLAVNSTLLSIISSLDSV
ncbi:hypothetical protein IW148_001344 [Coemansia sp. RSA 1199]|nr:hypothetical protein IW148_001344 [Coemansia sp. RSA 1199]